MYFCWWFFDLTGSASESDPEISDQVLQAGDFFIVLGMWAFICLREIF